MSYIHHIAHDAHAELCFYCSRYVSHADIVATLHAQAHTHIDTAESFASSKRRECVLVAGQMVESDGSEEAAEAVENLLESYFMQIDGTYDRLVSICKLSPLLSDCSADHKLGRKGPAGTVAYLSHD